MRIRSLHLKNFRRHADTHIELPDGVTALIGANGSGKSSLLEGIAFALFGTDGLRTGKALVRRDGAPPGDAVEATLEVQLGGQALTIHRELRGKALTPQASLVVDGAVVVPNGAGSSEAVTQQVSKRLGMGPDTFFTTVVARQGELARLANESPADRKRMVLRMVGVDRIDGAIEHARERRRAAQAALEALRRVARDPAEAEAKATQARQAVAAADHAAKDAAQAWAVAQAHLAALSQQVMALEAHAEQRRSLALEFESAQRAAAQKQDAVGRTQADLQLALAAQDAVMALTPAAARLTEVQLQWQDAQHALALARQRAVQLQVLARLDLDLARAQQAQQAIAPPPSEAGLDIAEVDVEAAEIEIAEARARLASARSTLVHSQERRRRVTALGEDAPCPTCERPLGGHLLHMAQHTHDAATRADDEVAAALAAEGQAAHKLMESRSRRERAADNQRRRERHALESAAASARVEELTTRVAEARSHLPPAAPAPAGVEQLRLELAAVQRAHDDRQRQAGLADRLPALQVLLQRVQAEQASAVQGLAEAESRLLAVPDVTVELGRARRDAAVAQTSERTAERTVHEAQRSHATASEAARHAEAVCAEQQRVAAEVAIAGAQAREWTALSDGHSGLLERFRDHVVDRIGPAVQAEASRLLAAFTGGRYSELLLDTSYNVYVTDGGVPYALERFSGGEQDLAHLALRLAVSRLLAERSGGAELRFLALDEVFGALDAQRRDLVVGALRSLGGLYSQVLVVSHQEALQEALDQAIVVGADGETSHALMQNG